MSLSLVYMVALLLGASYAVIAGVFSALFGGHDVHADGGVPEGGHDIHVPVLSPNIIASFLAGFGGAGILLHSYARLAAPLELAGATTGGGLLAFGTFALMSAIFMRTQSGSEYRIDELQGQIAEVSLPIPAVGLGEIVYIKKSSRSSGAAKSAHGKPIAKHARVRITEVVGSTFSVEELEKTEGS